MYTHDAFLKEKTVKLVFHAMVGQKSSGPKTIHSDALKSFYGPLLRPKSLKDAVSLFTGSTV